MSPDLVSRRALLALGLATFAAPALAAPPRAGRLAFAVFRNGVEVGRHRMTFQGPADAPRVLTEVEMLVKLGPVPVFRYRHTADERWADGRFASLETRTDANGKVRRVAARRTPGGVVIEAGKSRIVAPAAAAPLTHWNAEILSGPLFNPQEGKLLRISAARRGPDTIRTAEGDSLRATRWSLRGEAEIDNWYDEAGAWAALSGKLPDGSRMEYRRLA